MANSPLTLSELVRAERSGALSADDTGVTPEADPEPLLLAEDKAAADGQSAPETDPAADFHGTPFSLGGQGTDGNDHIPRGRWWNFIYGDDADNIIEMVDSYGYDEDGRQILTTGHHVNEVYGGAGKDILQGNSGKDWLYGQDGNDIIHGGGNRDILEGGYGDDVIYGDADDDRITGGKGHDLLYGGDGDDTMYASNDVFGTGDYSEIYGEDGNDTLAGSWNGTVLLDGGRGNDSLEGGDSIDTMKGGAGNDTYVVDNARDGVDETGGAGIDTVLSALTFSLMKTKGVVENLTLTGTGKIDATGNAGNNLLTGNAGANRIDGGAGNDRILGKLGMDVLTGGLGKDSFVFDTAPNAKANMDRITDFNVKDETIELENAVFTKLTKTGVLAKGFLAANAKGIAMDKDDVIVYNTKTGALSYDADGNGKAAAIQFATLDKMPVLTALDFIVI